MLLCKLISVKKYSIFDSIFVLVSTDDSVQVAALKKTPPKVWIIGASQVRRAEPVALQTYGENFGLNAQVLWFGKGGMGWGGVMPRFNQELSVRNAPDVLVLHAGGNDLGLVDPKDLASQMEMDLRKLRGKFPKMQIVFSLLHERQRWRYGAAPKMEQARREVNATIKRLLPGLQCVAVDHHNIRFFHRGSFVPDGVHFTKHGNQIFLDNIHQVVQKVLKVSTVFELLIHFYRNLKFIWLRERAFGLKTDLFMLVNFDQITSYL